MTQSFQSNFIYIKKSYLFSATLEILFQWNALAVKYKAETVSFVSLSQEIDGIKRL